MIISNTFFVKSTLFLFLILMSNMILITLSFENNGVKCIDRERHALLSFKAGLVDESNLLSSWQTRDMECCKWKGIICENRTNHIVSLKLPGPEDLLLDTPLRGNISTSLSQLVSLTYLDLSNNDFNTIPIPDFIGSFTKLQHLNLSHCNFISPIPVHIRNLSMLRVLDLRGKGGIYGIDFEWFSGFPLLQHLDLSGITFDNTGNWLTSIQKLTKLKKLYLSDCAIQETLPDPYFSLTNESSSLAVIDLSHNMLTSSTFLWFLNYSTRYSYIDFSDNSLGGNIPDVFMNLTSLSYLSLSSTSLEGRIPDSLGNIVSLVYLDFSSNNLEGTIPYSFGNLTLISYLDLSMNNLEGTIPYSFGNLTLISYLDLSRNNLEGTIPYSFGNLTLISYLDLSRNNLEGTIPYSLGNLTLISSLDLSWNNLQGGFPCYPGNLSNLVTLKLSDNKLEGDLTHMNEFLRESLILELLDLSNNSFYGSIPSLSRFSIMKTVDLGRNQLNGSFIENKLSLPYLRILRVAGNRVTGRLPDFTSCLSLSVLELNDNRFNGTLTKSIGYLSNLGNLDLHSNDFEGTVSETHLFNLTTLVDLDMSFNPKVSLNISSSWNPPFQLDTLKLVGCNLGPSFPKWLQKQKQITYLDISNSQIYDSVPNWFWNTSFILYHLNMSHNHMYGILPNFMSKSTFTSLDLRSNGFNGSLPYFSSSTDYLDLSKNKFSGDINNFCNGTYNFYVLDLSENQLSGEFSQDCFKNMAGLFVLNLGSNNFSGLLPVPGWDNWGCSLSALHLRNNSFSGEIPTSLRYCSNLKILDLGENHFTGEIPTWIGESLSDVGVLSLRSNKLSGALPSSLCLLANIQILDISMNNVSGSIPRCVSNFTNMRIKPIASEYDTFFYVDRASDFQDNAYVMWKGQWIQYTNTLGLVKVIDLSSNNLVGEIPTEITILEGLIALNLSRNNLVGPIPSDINKFEYLNFLDLSENNLSGRIPTSLSELSHLGMLNLSFNALSGRIPWSTHLQTFGALSYVGNSELCGSPLSKSCPGDQMPQIPTSNNSRYSDDYLAQDDMYITKWFYISTAIGFILAFWGTIGIITFNEWCGTRVSKLLKGWRIGGI